MSKKSAVIVSDPSWDDPDYAPGLQQDPWVEESESVVEIDPSSLENQIKVGDRVEGWHPFSQAWIEVEITKVNRKSFQGIDENGDKWVGMTQWRLPNSISAQELALDSHSQEPSSDSISLDLQKSTPTVQTSLNSGTLESPTTETCESSQEESEPISLLPHQTANPSQSEESAGVLTTSEIASPPSLERSLTSDQNSSASKMSPDYLAALSDPDGEKAHILQSSPELLSRLATNGKKSPSAAPNLERPGVETDCLLLESPTALSSGSDRKKSCGKRMPPAGQTKLEVQLKQEGAIKVGEVANPEFLESGSGVGIGFTDPQDKRSAWEFLQETESSANAAQPSETRLIQELQRSPSTASLLSEFGFIPSVDSAEEERQQCDRVATYKDWEIYFCIPNGGIIACVICRGDEAYQFPVGDTDEDYEFHFDYLDDGGVLAHTKKAIDALGQAATEVKYGKVGISFGWTSDRLHQKTVTRRNWKDNHAAKFIKAYEQGLKVPALDKDQRYEGKQIGWLTLTDCPYKTPDLTDIDQDEVTAEGYPELTPEQFIDKFFNGNINQSVWVVRFTFEALPESENNTIGKTNDSSIHNPEEITTTPRDPQSNPIPAGGGTPDQRASSDQDREEQHTSEKEPAIVDGGWVHEDRRGEALSSDGSGKESIQQVRREWLDPQLVIIDAGTQSRVATSLETVQRYAELMREGLWNWEQQPLPVVFLAPSGTLYAADAHHRTVAATLANASRVLYEVREGTLPEAILYSCTANGNHGLQPTPKDRRKSIELFLDTRELLPDGDDRKVWGSRLIAKYLGLPESGYRTVVNILKERREKQEKQSGKISTVTQELQEQPESLGLSANSTQVLPDAQDQIAPWEAAPGSAADLWLNTPSKKENLRTLEEIWELALQSMGVEQFDLDPYQSGAPAKEVFLPEEGLKQNWNGRTVFLFPPDAQAHEWIENLLEEYDAGNIDEAVVLVRTRLEKPWFHGLLEFPTCLLFNRVEANGSRWNGAVSFIGKNPDQFCSVFGEVGTIIKVLEAGS